MRHLSRNWSMPDPFGDTCGCQVAPCGGVVDGSNPTCTEHAPAECKTIRSSHDAGRCPATAGLVPLPLGEAV